MRAHCSRWRRKVEPLTLPAVAVRLRHSDESMPAVLHAMNAWLIAPEQARQRALIAEIHHAALLDPDVSDLLAA